MCAYAHRQWELTKAVSANPEESSFYRAMQIELEKEGGVVLVPDDTVLDEEGKVVLSGPPTAFTRIWCAVEESKALELGKQLDAGAVADKMVQMLTEGLAEADRLNESTFQSPTALKASRKKTFPVSLLNTAISVELEHDQATQEADRRHILNSVAGEGYIEEGAF